MWGRPGATMCVRWAAAARPRPAPPRTGGAGADAAPAAAWARAQSGATRRRGCRAGLAGCAATPRGRCADEHRTDRRAGAEQPAARAATGGRRRGRRRCGGGWRRRGDRRERRRWRWQAAGAASIQARMACRRGRRALVRAVRAPRAAAVAERCTRASRMVALHTAVVPVGMGLSLSHASPPHALMASRKGGAGASKALGSSLGGGGSAALGASGVAPPLEAAPLARAALAAPTDRRGRRRCAQRYARRGRVGCLRRARRLRRQRARPRVLVAPRTST